MASSEYNGQLFDVDDCDLVRLILQLLICAFTEIHLELRLQKEYPHSYLEYFNFEFDSISNSTQKIGPFSYLYCTKMKPPSLRYFYIFKLLQYATSIYNKI